MEDDDATSHVPQGIRCRCNCGVRRTADPHRAVRNLLTPNRLALLRAVRSGRPGSIYELSRMVNRDLKNVQDDLRILETYGLVRMADATRKGKRRVRVPRSLVDQIELKIAI